MKKICIFIGVFSISFFAVMSVYSQQGGYNIHPGSSQRDDITVKNNEVGIAEGENACIQNIEIIAGLAYLEMKNDTFLWAVRLENIRTVERLLQSGRNPNYELHGYGNPQQFGFSLPLLWAICLKNEDMVKLLLDYGAFADIPDLMHIEIDVLFLDPLLWAVRSGNDQIVELILEAQARQKNTSQENKFGRYNYPSYPVSPPENTDQR